jgi:HTH-type transcriptional regulator/antitoxin HipB
VEDIDLCGLLRRVRRIADLSQRELAGRLGVSAAAIGHAEAGRRDLPTGVLVRAARLAGLRVALLDADGREVTGMGRGTVRDAAGRRYPAHLDTRNGDDGWWYPGDRSPHPSLVRVRPRPVAARRRPASSGYPGRPPAARPR